MEFVIDFVVVTWYHQEMNVLVSRIVFILKSTQHLYPCPLKTSKLPSPKARDKVAVLQMIKLSKSQNHSTKISGMKPTVEDMLEKYFIKEFSIDCRKADPTLFKQLTTFIQIADHHLDILRIRSLDNLIKYLLPVLNLSKELHRQFLIFSAKKDKAVSVKSKLREEILEIIYHLNLMTQKSFENTIRFTIIFNLVQALENKYFAHMTLTPMNYNPNTATKPFWEVLSDTLIGLMNQVSQTYLEENHQIIKILNVSFPSLDILDQSKIPYLCEKIVCDLISKIRKINYIANFTQAGGGTFIKHFYQANHPFKALIGGSCAGFFAKWAYHLKTNPPKTTAKPSPVFSDYIDFLHSLRQEKYPPRLLATQAWLGETDIDKTLVILQLHLTKLFNEYKVKTLHYPHTSCEGENVAIAALEAFRTMNPKEPVSIIGIVLKTTNKQGGTIHNEFFQPHILGIARISLLDSESNDSTKNKVVYRLIDSDFTESELQTPEALIRGLKAYFDILHINRRCSEFILHPFNEDFFNSVKTLNFDKDILQLLKEQKERPIVFPKPLLPTSSAANPSCKTATHAMVPSNQVGHSKPKTHIQTLPAHQLFKKKPIHSLKWEKGNQHAVNCTRVSLPTN